MGVDRPVSTNVMRQSWMSLLSSSTFCPPSAITKLLDSASLYSRKYFFTTSAL